MAESAACTLCGEDCAAWGLSPETDYNGRPIESERVSDSARERHRHWLRRRQECDPELGGHVGPYHDVHGRRLTRCRRCYSPRHDRNGWDTSLDHRRCFDCVAGVTSLRSRGRLRIRPTRRSTWTADDRARDAARYDGTGPADRDRAEQAIHAYLGAWIGTVRWVASPAAMIAVLADAATMLRVEEAAVRKPMSDEVRRTSAEVDRIFHRIKLYYELRRGYETILGHNDQLEQLAAELAVARSRAADARRAAVIAHLTERADRLDRFPGAWSIWRLAPAAVMELVGPEASRWRPRRSGAVASTIGRATATGIGMDGGFFRRYAARLAAWRADVIGDAGQFDDLTPALIAAHARTSDDGITDGGFLRMMDELRWSCGPVAIIRGEVIACERPRILRLDEAGRLHADDGPAALWPDGFEVWARHGEAVTPPEPAAG